MTSLVLSAALVMSPACKPEPRSTVAAFAALEGWQGDQLSCLNEIVRLESRWNPKADNKHSSAYGLFQVLKTPQGTPLTTQVIKGIAYIKHRYKTPCRALVYHSRHGHY